MDHARRPLRWDMERPPGPKGGEPPSGPVGDAGVLYPFGTGPVIPASRVFSSKISSARRYESRARPVSGHTSSVGGFKRSWLHVGDLGHNLGICTDGTFPVGVEGVRWAEGRTEARAADGAVFWAGGPDALRGCRPAGGLASPADGQGCFLTFDVCATIALRPGSGRAGLAATGLRLGNVCRSRRCWARVLDFRMEVRILMLQKVTGNLRISRRAARFHGRAGIVGHHSAPLVSRRRRSCAGQEETGE